jgi:hypothetical protein
LLPSSSSVLISGNLAYSGYDVKIEEDLVEPRTSTISNLNGNLDFTYYLNKNELRYGVGLVSNTTNYTTFSPRLEKQEFEANNSEMFAFLKYKWNYSKRLVFEPNVRLQYYASLSKIRIEPRAGLKFFLTEKIRIKGALGMYSQNLVSTQSDRDVIALFQGFISSPDQVYSKNESTSGNPDNPSIKSALQKSTHFVAGVEFDLNEDIEITVEPYIKQFKDFVNINRNRVFPEQPVFIEETGLARGIDFLMKYDREPFYLQMSYSLGKVDRTFNNYTYAPIFDRRHNVNVVGSYNFGKKKDWDVNIRWNLGSGFPFTQTVALYENLDLKGNLNQNLNNQNGNLGIYYGNENEFNKGRQPYFHRLDFSISKFWKFGNNQKLEAIFSVVNSYNRQNVFYFDRVRYERINQLPILPALGVNYAF